MRTKLDPIIFGDTKKINFSGYNLGSLIKAVTFDLEEYGVKGVQGLPLKGKEATALITYESKAGRAKDPKIVAGVFKKDLWLAVWDKKDKKFEAITPLCKNYTVIKEKLAKNSAEVVNINPNKDDKRMNAASKAQAKKRGTTAKDKADAAFGGITGDIVLCAHGSPKTVPGRVIGEKLGKMDAKGIVKYLVGSKDPKKSVGKEYAGTIWLSGCYTASGGPEASKKDDATAKKVKDLLFKVGYKDLSVVGMPGPSITYLENEDRSVNGKSVKPGEKSARHGMTTKHAIKALEKKADPIWAGLEKAWKKYDGTQDEFFAEPKVKPIITKYNKLADEIESIKELQDSGTFKKHIAKLEGRFGLRNLAKELANVK